MNPTKILRRCITLLMPWLRYGQPMLARAMDSFSDHCRNAMREVKKAIIASFSPF